MKKSKKIKFNRGMTYVELIVVLSIFSVMSSIVLFNYGKFQQKVDIKNLANDIALKIVQSQKDAMAGKLQVDPFTCTSPSCIPAPAYGVYFDLRNTVDPSNPNPNVHFNQEFIYFADLDNDGAYTPSSCPSGECLEKVTINNGFSIQDVTVNGGECSSVGDVGITFKRPDSGALFSSLVGNPIPCTVSPVSSIDLDIYSKDNSSHAKISVYASGRVQIQ